MEKLVKKEIIIHSKVITMKAKEKLENLNLIIMIYNMKGLLKIINFMV